MSSVSDIIAHTQGFSLFQNYNSFEHCLSATIKSIIFISYTPAVKPNSLPSSKFSLPESTINFISQS